MLVLVLVGLFFTPLAGCADPDGTPVGADPGEPDPGFAPESYPGRFRASGLVLEDASHGPQLCRNVALSHPPRCGGPDIVGWSWDGLEHSEVGSARWGSFELVGTYDGKRFTLTEPPGPPRQAGPEPAGDFSSACPPPADGWRVVDGARATDDALQQAIALASSSPVSAGLWIDQNGGENDPRRLVLNALFTDDLPGNEARLRAVWGGALCVAPAARTTAELTRVQTELAALPGVLSTGIDTLANRVTVEVYVATDARRQELAARYGPDTVVLTGFLSPA
ncbi:hypothetical protein AB0J74_01790 [Asanoa sp. NPDC049573]|uniref:hypothetical protein n=1 Tax=Asanoa sp. NPDC049573 TaxID=3155396 RepID=UPI0034430149